MASNLYQVYLNNVLALAQTIVIKSVDTEQGLNQYIADFYGATAVDQTDPTTWKYYLNLNGQYHPTDEVITVISMDTLQPISFTKENLAIHTATARGYQYGTRAYQELIAQYPSTDPRYPSHEMLILGILYPVDINAAIAARDGLILGWPPQYVESNEYSLMAKLQAWVDAYKERWCNPQYNLSDSLYPAASLGVMYLNLVPTILNTRLDACLTNEAHSYHVRQFLASHGALDQFLDQMTLSQSLFLYRNIRYIERNSGQKGIFTWLVEHIMTERGLPIGSYSMRHDLSQMPGEIKPTITFLKTPLNTAENETGSDSADLLTLLTREEPLARDNALYLEDNETDITEAMQNSRANSLPTKIFESSMVDYTNSTPYPLPDILLNHWLWLSHQGLYTAFVSVTNPATGEIISLRADDAFTFMWYCFNGSIGITLTDIPTVIAMRVQRIPLPTAQDLASIVESRLVPMSVIQNALAVQPTLTTLQSVDAFYAMGHAIYEAANIQRLLYQLQEHNQARGQVQAMVDRIYTDTVCPLSTTQTTYADWFTARNIHVEDFSTDQLKSLYTNLVQQATGQALNSQQSLAALQAAMVAMLAQLSSYSVQFLTEINTSTLIPVGQPAIRVGDIKASGEAQIDVPVISTDIIDDRASIVNDARYDINQDNYGESISVSIEDGSDYRIKVDIKSAPIGTVYRTDIWSASVKLRPTNPLPTLAETNGIIPVIGLDLWLALDPNDRAQFLDVYGDEYYGYIPPLTLLTSIITQRTLNGLNWVPSVGDIGNILRNLQLNGLYFDAGPLALTGTLPIPMLFGLTFPDESLDLSILLRQTILHGLEWVHPGADISEIIRIGISNGLVWKQNFELSRVIVNTGLYGLFWKQPFTSLPAMLKVTSFKGPKWNETVVPLSNTLPIPSPYGLMYRQGTYDMSRAIVRLTLDGIRPPFIDLSGGGSS